MANNDFSAWADEYVGVCTASNVSTSVRFGDLLPIMQQKPDVFEMADRRTCDRGATFVSEYSGLHQSMGYGYFAPDL